MLSPVLGFQQIQLKTVPLLEMKENPANGGWEDTSNWEWHENQKWLPPGSPQPSNLLLSPAIAIHPRPQTELSVPTSETLTAAISYLSITILLTNSITLAPAIINFIKTSNV